MHVARFYGLGRLQRRPAWSLSTTHANSGGAIATLTMSYGSLVAERLFSPQPSAISGGVFSLLALSIFYLAMELWQLKADLLCLEVAGMHIEPRMLAYMYLVWLRSGKQLTTQHLQSPQRRGKSRGMWSDLCYLPIHIPNPLPNTWLR
jgi:hypothetical protein